MDVRKMEIEIGKNLAEVMGGIISNANVGGVSAGDEIKKAFNLDLTSALVHLGTDEQVPKTVCNAIVKMKKQ